MIIAQALAALRAHALQCGRLPSDDPDQLLPDFAIPSHKVNSIEIGHSSLGRPRARRDQDSPSTFGISRSKKSIEVVQANSGLGAALLSVFNDIVSHESSGHDDLPLDLDVASSDDDELQDVNISDESSTLKPEHEKGTDEHSYVESESSELIGAFEVSFQGKHPSQNNAVSDQMHHIERSDGAVAPLPPVTITTTAVGHPDNAVPPTQGVATPRRKKLILTSKNSRDVTQPASALSSSVHLDIQIESNAEMDM